MKAIILYGLDSSGNPVPVKTNGSNSLKISVINQKNKGYYATSAELIAAFPVCESGCFAMVGETGTVWYWDVLHNQWEDGGGTITVTSVNGRTGDVEGLIDADGSKPLTANWDIGNFKITIGTGINLKSLTASELIASDASKNIVSLPVATYPSLSELSYVKGVTSAIQTQFASKVSGPASATNNAIAIYDNITGKIIKELTLGTANQIVGVNNLGTAYENKDFAIGSLGTDFNILHTINTVIFNIPDASASARGLITTGAQTLAGAKTFSGAIIVDDTTDSTSKTTGSIQTDGGLGVAKALWVGEEIHVERATDPTIFLRETGAHANSYFRLQSNSDVVARISSNNGTTGENRIEIDPFVSDGSSPSNVRFFRNLNTTGTKTVLFFKGDNTATIHARIGVDGSATWFGIGGGQFGIGISTFVGSELLRVNGDIRIEGNTDSASSITGSIQTDGGLGVVKDIFCGNRVRQLGCYAGIYVADASTAQSIAAGASYVKSTAFTTDGFSANCTPASATDKITITKTGKYRVSNSCSFTSGTNLVTFRGVAFLNGVEQSQCHWVRKVGTAGDVGSASFNEFVDVTSVPWDLDFRIRHDNIGAIDFTIIYGSLNVEYVGET